MDPKSLPSLDPKLKEAYERVMATSLPTNQTPAQPSTPPAVTPATPPVQSVTPQPTSSATPPPPVAPMVPEPVVVSNVVTKPDEATTSYVSSQTVTVSPTKPSSSSTYVSTNATTTVGKPKFSPVILIVAGTIFFVVYTLFWLRFFNVSLPFLP